MHKYRIIGNMTGNSMDAVDLVLTEFEGDKMTDLCSFSRPFSAKTQQEMAELRLKVYQKNKTEILALPEFHRIHDDYIAQIGTCIHDMLQQHNIDKSTVDAIGFHGKTLDHNPPSVSDAPYTLQIGSGQMLADLTGIPVVYDFRSDYIMHGFEGAPLIPPHNAHIAHSEGDGIYFNGGNTSNFALIKNRKAVLASDAGPFNEYTDAYIRQHTSLSYDFDGTIGLQGHLIPSLLQALFDFRREFYEKALPKSGDPAYYRQADIFYEIQKHPFAVADVVHTFEYFAAYLAVYTLTLVASDITLPEKFVLFGGGWKNPVVRQSFEQLLHYKGFVLPEHKQAFSALKQRFKKLPYLKQTPLGDFMEARLMADMAYYRLTNRPWELPDHSHLVSGVIARPNSVQQYLDKINRAAKGWQKA